MQRLKRLKVACSDAGMVLLGAAASVVVLAQTAAEWWQDHRADRREARQLAAQQLRAEDHVYATAAGIVADHYALYRDLYEPPHIPHSDHAPA